MPPDHRRRTAFCWGAGGALSTAGPAVALAAHLLFAQGSLLPLELRLPVAIAAGTAVSLGGLLLLIHLGLGRILVTGGLWIVPLLAPTALLHSPLLTFLLGLAVLGGSAAAWLAPFGRVAGGRASRDQHRAVGVRWSAWVSLATLVVTLASGLTGARAGFAIAASVGWTVLWLIPWLRRSFRVSSPRAIVVGIVLVAALTGAGLSLPDGSAAVAFLAAVPVIAVLGPPGIASGWGQVLEHPARLLVTTFLALCLLGTALLSLPVCSEAGRITVLDAAFTAVSAVCVTGLIVLDTPNAFGGAGEAVILLLIQLGGLGIMTFYTAALSAVGRRLSLRHELAVVSALSIEDRSAMRNALGRVLGLTFACEAVGAAVLFLSFWSSGDLPAEALWRAVFTSVSAFCNAGFALQTDSLVPYQSAPVVLHTVAALIVLGGLSPSVVLALPAWRRRASLPLQTRLALVAAAVLLLAGFVAYLSLEWSSSLDGLSFVDRLHNAWFQSVTLRTAGFNSVDLARSLPATQTLMIVFMFIGGSPGGTAGGVKTTTAAILLLAVVAALRRKPDAIAFSRRVGHVSVYKAAAVMTLGILAVSGALIALQLTQPMPLPIAVFETVSALGTVGLSLGGTSMLDSVGKVLIMTCMFAGRVGPLTLFLFLAERSPRTTWVYPPEEVDVG